LPTAAAISKHKIQPRTFLIDVARYQHGHQCQQRGQRHHGQRDAIHPQRKIRPQAGIPGTTFEHLDRRTAGIVSAEQEQQPAQGKSERKQQAPAATTDACAAPEKMASSAAPNTGMKTSSFNTQRPSSHPFFLFFHEPNYASQPPGYVDKTPCNEEVFYCFFNTTTNALFS
jgi:hypothetical protein